MCGIFFYYNNMMVKSYYCPFKRIILYIFAFTPFKKHFYNCIVFYVHLQVVSMRIPREQDHMSFFMGFKRCACVCKTCVYDFYIYIFCALNSTRMQRCSIHTVTCFAFTIHPYVKSLHCVHPYIYMCVLRSWIMPYERKDTISFVSRGETLTTKKTHIRLVRFSLS